MEDILRVVSEILLTFLTIFVIWNVILKRCKLSNFKKFLISTIIFLVSFGVVSYFMNTVKDTFYVVAIAYLFLMAISVVADWIRLLLELRKR